MVLVMVLCCALPAAAQGAAQGAPRADAAAKQQPAVPRPDSPIKQQLKDFERFADGALRNMYGDQAFGILQEPKAAYVPGFGVIVHVEVNLYQMRMLTPFGRPYYSEEELKTEREQKAARLKQLRVNLRELLIQEAARLAKLGSTENAALVVHLFNQRPYPEVPDQVVVSGSVPALAALEGRTPQPAELEKLVSLREF
jgi:hypothetical protein